MKCFVKIKILAPALLAVGISPAVYSQPLFGGLPSLSDVPGSPLVAIYDLGMPGGELSLPDLDGPGNGMSDPAELFAPGSDLPLPGLDSPASAGMTDPVSMFGDLLGVTSNLASVLNEVIAPAASLAGAAPLPFDATKFLDFERTRFDASMFSGGLNLVIAQAGSAQSRLLREPSLPQGETSLPADVNSPVDVKRTRFDASLLSGSSDLLTSQLQGASSRLPVK